MIIESITLRNFKSFGNNKQTVKFRTDKGELILLSGDNGAGKSSLQQSFDFSFFGVVRGKDGKKVPAKILPNWINNDLETEIRFKNMSMDNVYIHREMNLNKASVEVFINDENKSKTFKQEKEKIIGYDFDTYKSFISMTVSDFANFIDLSPDEKRKVINKLFNLQDLDNYLSITNTMIKQTSEEILKISSQVDSNNKAINSYKENIATIIKSGAIDKEKEILKLKDQISQKSEEFKQLALNGKNLEDQIFKLEKERQDLDNQKNVLAEYITEKRIELRHLDEKLDIYRSGVCPLCSTDLKDEKHQHDLSDILSNKKIIESSLITSENSRSELILKITQILNQKDTASKLRNSIILKRQSLKTEANSCSIKIKELEIDGTNSISIDELNRNIDELKEKNIENNTKIDRLSSQNRLHQDLRDVFSNKGVRRNIIKNITKPINVYLKDILDALNSKYNVKIDDEFEVELFARMINKIHSESVSMGEAKKINLAIALSYIKLILKFKKLNILFLDEVFSSLQPENVELALKILKSFTEEFKINIIIVDPKVYFRDGKDFGYELFDRIIKIVPKLTFSNIEEEL